MDIPSEVILRSLAIHKINEDDGLIISNQAVNLNDPTLSELLVKYFFKPFKAEERYRFTHESSLDYNEIYSFTSQIFSNPSNLHTHSVEIARHLYSHSRHQNIKDGDIFVTYFENCTVEDEVTDAIGIFKV